MRLRRGLSRLEDIVIPFGTQVICTTKTYLVLRTAVFPAALGEQFACASTTVAAGVPVQLLAVQSRYTLLLVYFEGVILLKGQYRRRTYYESNRFKSTFFYEST